MAEKKTGAARATAYKNAYAAAHYKRVPLQLLKKEYEDLRAGAELAGESVNGFVRRAVRERLERRAQGGDGEN